MKLNFRFCWLLMLCNQFFIPGYGQLASYTLVSGTSETWTPTNNPVFNVSGSPTPVSVIYIDSSVIIPEGSGLTLIGMTLHFGSSGHIYVFHSTFSSLFTGGRLVLNNSEVTSNPANPDGMWGGVIVDGDAAQTQLTYATSHQGMLTLLNNSTVSNAHIGVDMGETMGAFTAGGGIVQAQNSTFKNNNIGTFFRPYQNYDAYGTPTHDISYFWNCNFVTDNAATVTGPGCTGFLIDVYGYMSQGVSISGSHFTNISGSSYTSYGICGPNMGFTVDEILHYPYLTSPPINCSFSNFTNGIYQASGSSMYTPTVKNSIFNNNLIGININGSLAPMVTNNTFNIPCLYRFTLHAPYYTGIESIGLNLMASTGYTVNSNTFQAMPSGIYPAASNKTVGTLAWNTELNVEDNKINNNTYKGLGTGNLANYRNQDGYTPNHGLWYTCNVHSSNQNDITTVGTDPSLDGIRTFQGYPAGSLYGPMYASGLPAANLFTTSTLISVSNLTNSNCVPFSYIYFASGSSLEEPGIPGVTAYDHYVTTAAVSPSDNCSLLTKLHRDLMARSSAYTPDENHTVTTNNINYYLNDSEGVHHRDSLYYWVSQLPGAAGHMATALMLLDDGYADSAYMLYHSILSRDPLDTKSKTEFGNYGSKLFDVQARISAYYSGLRRDVQYAYANALDPDSLVAADTALLSRQIFSAGSLDTLIGVFDSSRSWARIGAENLLNVFAPDTLKNMLSVLPDTLLYPEVSNSLLPASAHAGVLMVTEVSQGPSLKDGLTGCEYAELLLGNCGADASPYVDISGWIVDDNSGNFNTSGCTATGISRGHYRLSPAGTGWKNMPVGSVLVMYNADINCYNLPDTFTIDTTHFIFWIPIHATASTSASSPFAVERYDGSENTDPGTYCSDTGTNVYTAAYGWASTISLATADAVQVRCPGCSPAHPVTPPFYQGMGYAPDTKNCMSSIAAGTNSLGGPVIYYPGTHLKFEFAGSSASDFSDAMQWTISSADPAGITPATLGRVNENLFNSVRNRDAGLPCCGYSVITKDHGASHQASAVSNVQGDDEIRVFPNPSCSSVRFNFPEHAGTTVRILDMLGRVVFIKTTSNSTIMDIDVSGYSWGVYFYQVTAPGLQHSGILRIGQ